MDREKLAKVVQHAKCNVFGFQDASNDAHRRVLAAVIKTAQEESATVLCEPSLTKSTTRPADIVYRKCPWFQPFFRYAKADRS